MSRKTPVSGTAFDFITLGGVEWEVEINWYVSDWSDETEIDSAYLVAFRNNCVLQPIDKIAMDISEMSHREFESLMVIANEHRSGGYECYKSTVAYDDWKADQL